MEQIHAIMQAADGCDSPVILQASAGVCQASIRSGFTSVMMDGSQVIRQYGGAIRASSSRKP